MSQYGMVIDLQKCVGCGACGIACKTENNTSDRANGQTHNWADFIYSMEGSYPAVDYAAIPVLCNHCSEAACVEVCPVEPKAMFKTEDGITMHNDERCIGCQACQKACPYSATNVDDEKAAYSVISFNESAEDLYRPYKDTTELVAGGTASGAEIAERVGQVPPYRTLYDHPDYESVRRGGITEKCTFCDHRVKQGELPYCVVSCPSSARVFGDLSDENSEPRKLLKKHGHFRLKEEAGTEPNVFYIRSFKAKNRAG